MGKVTALANLVSSNWRDSYCNVDVTAWGDRWVSVTNVTSKDVIVDAVSRSDLGSDFRLIDPAVVIAPGRTSWIDFSSLEHRFRAPWPGTVDSDLDYKLVAEFGMWSDGVGWRFGTGPDDEEPAPFKGLTDAIGNEEKHAPMFPVYRHKPERHDYGPIIPRPALTDRP